MLIVPIVYVPQNSRLLIYNKLVNDYFSDSVSLLKKPVVKIPLEVEVNGNYGWTGNDLWNDYKLACNQLTEINEVTFLEWPSKDKPRLCFLKAEEDQVEANFTGNVAIPTKYANLALDYLKEFFPESQPRFFSGQVEKQIRLGKARFAIDIVCSGRTLRNEQLTIEEVIFSKAGFVLLAKDI